MVGEGPELLLIPPNGLRRFSFGLAREEIGLNQVGKLESPPQGPKLRFSDHPVLLFGVQDDTRFRRSNLPLSGLISYLEPTVRFELTTCGLRNRCSTPELRRLPFFETAPTSGGQRFPRIYLNQPTAARQRNRP